MSMKNLAGQRKLFALAMLAVFFAMGAWFFSPGIPVIWGPYASAADRELGRELFEHEWQPNDPLAHGDGLGPVFNARSCVACHFQGGVGGGGELVHNAIGFEVLPGPNSPEFVSGTIHNFSIEPRFKESFSLARQVFPVIKSVPVETPATPGCPPHTITIPDFDPLRTQSVNTTPLFGIGWIDCISDKSITHYSMKRKLSGTVKEMSLDFSDNIGGRVRILPDGRVGKFGWKAQFATLKEFVAAACANEIGLGTPYSQQAVPLGSDYPTDIPPDLDRRQFKAMVGFVATLPKPVERLPENEELRKAAIHGKELFNTIGCAVCHVPNMGGVEGVYSDFKLHVLDDPKPGPSGGFEGYGSVPLPNFPRPSHEPEPQEWKTQPLWGVADSAPYFHDGASMTLEDAILRHKGEARGVTQLYTELPRQDQIAIIRFLKTLQAPPDAIPLADDSVTNIAKRK